jgi:broad specificity phosphatase PhoE
VTLRHVLLARHGETDWNAAGRWQGHTDVPLNETGRAQARALAERLRPVGIAAVATSDLARARATAEIVAAALGLEIGLVDPELREQRFGRFEGLTAAECVARYPEDRALRADPRLAPPDGETREAFLARLLPAVARAAERLAAPPLIVTHGGAMRLLLDRVAAASGVPLIGPASGRILNGSVLRVSLEAGVPVAAEWLDVER